MFTLSCTRSASSIARGGQVPGGGSLMVAVRLGDLVSPLRHGGPCPGKARGLRWPSGARNGSGLVTRWCS